MNLRNLTPDASRHLDRLQGLAHNVAVAPRQRT